MKFMRRPIIVDAIQIPDWKLDARDYARWKHRQPQWFQEQDIWMRDEGLVIPTLEGDSLCRWNNWVVRGIKGELYPCDNEIFHEIYTRVEDEEDAQLLSEESLRQ